MADVNEILKQMAESLKEDIKTVVGRFADSIESNVSEYSFEITGSQFIPVLIYGRKPTRPNAPKGNPTFQEIIYEWIKEKGIQPFLKGQTQEQLSWVISSHIHKHGDRLYQFVQGGGKPKDIFSVVLNSARIDAFTNSIGASLVVSTSSDLIKEFNEIKKIT